MREMLLFLTRSLVEDPDAVEVEELEEDGDLVFEITVDQDDLCLLYTSPSPRDRTRSRMPSSA